MDETDAVLQRLRRIERLRADAQPAALLGELRLLVPEAEAWARAEGDARARAAARNLSRAAPASGSSGDPGLTRRTTPKLREEAEGMS